MRMPTYTIAIEPSRSPGAVTATSSDGHRFIACEPLLNGARYWQSLGAPSSATIVTIWSSGPGHWALRSTIGQAAKLTVREGKRDSPYFTKWTPFPSD
jgi:hypothetical protein